MKKTILAMAMMSIFTLTYSQNENRIVKYNSAGTGMEASHWECESDGDIFPKSNGLRNIGNDTAGIRDIYVGNASGIQMLGSNAFTVTEESSGDKMFQVLTSGGNRLYGASYWNSQADATWGTVTFGGDRFLVNGGSSKNLSLGAGSTSNYVIINTSGRAGFGTGISGSTINTIGGKVHIVGEGNDSTTISLLIEDSGNNPLLRFLDNGNMHVLGKVIANSTWLSSDQKLKENVKRIPDALNKLTQVNGVNYNYREMEGLNLDKGNQMGVIAQNVEKIFPELVRERELNGMTYKIVNYTGLIPVLIEAVKELNEEIVILKNSNQSIGNSEIPTFQNSTSPHMEAALYQNAPNPFNETTNIQFRLPEDYSNAAIYVYNMQGNQLRKYTLQPEQNQLTISASDLQPGMYMYALVIDNKEIDTKRMILTD